jgi:acyl-CoA reductase-like NAD-dependent aldehyde dehydrogenase
MSNRIDVKKTYKLYINGAFPRTESGRTYEVKNAKGVFVANPCLASRKDLRDAVVAARAAHAGWNKATAYNQVRSCIASPKCSKVVADNL